MIATNTQPTSSRGWLATVSLACAVGLFALALRVPFIRQVGPIEGGGDEWWSVWRSWSVLYEGGRPGNYLHPALYYDVGAVWLRMWGAADPLADFIRHQYEYVRSLEYLSAFCGAATVSVVFVLGRKLFGSLAGVIAAALLCVLPLHIVYSQAARVDTLFTLACSLFWLGLIAVDEHGRRRDSVLSGLLLGLAVSANYPGALLVVPFVWIHVARRSWVPLLLGGFTALATFVITNPALLSEPGLVWDGFLFQAGMAAHAHPGREGVEAGFYWQVLREQGLLLIIVGVIGAIWFAIRGARLPRILAVTAVFYLLCFALLRTQFDRYILPPLPWLCVLAGGVCATLPRSRWSRAGAIALAVAMVAQSGWNARHRIAPDYRRTTPMPAEVAQGWLLEHARPDDRIWIDADILPLMQAVFADPGGPLHDALQAAFGRAAPAFRATLIKGERIEGSANFKPELIRGRTVRLAVACDGVIAQSHGEQQAFYAELEKCPVVLTFDEQCRVRECRTQ